MTVYPAGTPAQEIIDDNPDGIMLSNGPGDPKECTGVIAEIKKYTIPRSLFSQSVWDIS